MYAGRHQKVAKIMAENMAEKDQRPYYLCRGTDAEGGYFFIEDQVPPNLDEAPQKIVPEWWVWHWGDHHVRGTRNDMDAEIAQVLVDHLIHKNLVTVKGPDGKDYLPRITVRLELKSQP